MALIPCPECHSEISDAAAACPRCGLPRPVESIKRIASQVESEEAILREGSAECNANPDYGTPFVGIVPEMIDLRTDRMWTAFDNGENIAWPDARRHAVNYRGRGYVDWRLPTIHELTTLMRTLVRADWSEGVGDWKSSHNCPIGSRHGNSSARRFFWSSETRGPRAAIVSCDDGRVSWIRQSETQFCYAVAVRSRTAPGRSAVEVATRPNLEPPSLRDLENESGSGSTLPPVRYDEHRAKKQSPIIVCSEVVIDVASELMWCRRDNGHKANWQAASRYARSCRVGGYSDWRLPTITELTGLAETRAVGTDRSSAILVTGTRAWAAETERSLAASVGVISGNFGVRWEKDDDFVLPVRSISREWDRLDDAQQELDDAAALDEWVYGDD